MLSMPVRIKKISLPSEGVSYERLLRGLRKLIENSLKNIRRYAETQKVLTYWNTGRLISQYLLKENHNVTREEIYDKLAEDLNINKRTLQQCVQFFGVYFRLDKKLPLSWSHYRYLMTLDNATERKRWEERIIKERIPALEFLNRLRESKQKDILDIPVSDEKDVSRGTLYTYRIIKVNYVQDNPQGFMVDCGFEIRIVLPPAKGKIDNSLIVESIKKEGDYALVISRKSKGDIFTYKALVERVIDGDTLLVKVDVGFGIWKRERLRLRGVDAPELGTAKGNLAKRFLEAELSACPFVVAKTYKSDKYDRYLVDVFYQPGAQNPQDTAETGALLNVKLLKKGLAKSI